MFNMPGLPRPISSPDLDGESKIDFLEDENDIRSVVRLLFVDAAGVMLILRKGVLTPFSSEDDFLGERDMGVFCVDADGLGAKGAFSFLPFADDDSVVPDIGFGAYGRCMCITPSWE